MRTARRAKISARGRPRAARFERHLLQLPLRKGLTGLQRTLRVQQSYDGGDVIEGARHAGRDRTVPEER